MGHGVILLVHDVSIPKLKAIDTLSQMLWITRDQQPHESPNGPLHTIWGLVNTNLVVFKGIVNTLRLVEQYLKDIKGLGLRCLAPPRAYSLLSSSTMGVASTVRYRITSSLKRMARSILAML